MTQVDVESSDEKQEARELDDRDFNLKFWFAEDGRINLRVSQRANWISDDMYSASSFSVHESAEEPLVADPGTTAASPPSYDQLYPKTLDTYIIPKMDIIMLAIGSSEEVSNFILFARYLNVSHGHRVRLASHPEHQAVIESCHLDFFSLRSNSKDMLPLRVPMKRRGTESNAHLARWRKAMQDVYYQSWQACVSPLSGLPFIPDVIVASPMCFSHMHCAERLGVPLQLLSTVPWTPTGKFPHPLTNVRSTNSTLKITNLLTYAAVESFMWNEIGNDINDFRTKTLGLQRMDILFAPGLLHRMRVPIIYISNDFMLEKPDDWGSHTCLCDPQSQVGAMGDFFHRHSSLSNRYCSITKNQLAYWTVAGSRSQLSSMAAAVLLKKGMIDSKRLCYHTQFKWDLAHRPWDPLTGLTAATSNAITSILLGVTAGPVEAYKQMDQSKKRDGKAGLVTTQTAGVESCMSIAVSTGKGIGDIMTAGLKTPMTFTYALAKGFHNLPELYGDTTVRKVDSITGWKSGLTVAGKGLGLGLYDGLAGVLMQPLQGGQTEGPKGFIKGFGKGLGGLVFKPAAGACGVTGYAFKGFFEEFRKFRGDGIEDMVAASRLSSGEHQRSQLPGDDEMNVLARWNALGKSD